MCSSDLETVDDFRDFRIACVNAVVGVDYVVVIAVSVRLIDIFDVSGHYLASEKLLWTVFYFLVVDEESFGLVKQERADRVAYS